MATDAFSITSFAIAIFTFVFNMVWAPFAKARTERIKLALDFKRKYTWEEQQHLDVLYAYMEEHGKNTYFTTFQKALRPGAGIDSEEKKVDNSRRILAAYWDELLENYEIGAVPTKHMIPAWFPRGPFWVPRDLMEGNFLRKAKDYMQLAEPIDVANWYRLGIHEQRYRKGPQNGELKGDYAFNHPLRPGRYSKIERHMTAGEVKEWHEKLTKYAEECKKVAGAPKGAELV